MVSNQSKQIQSEPETHLCSNDNHIILRPMLVGDVATASGSEPVAPAGDPSKRDVVAAGVVKKTNPGSVSSNPNEVSFNFKRSNKISCLVQFMSTMWLWLLSPNACLVFGDLCYGNVKLSSINVWIVGCEVLWLSNYTTRDGFLLFIVFLVPQNVEDLIPLVYKSYISYNSYIVLNNIYFIW